MSHFRGNGKIEGTCNLERSSMSQESLAVIARMDLYLASAEDSATMGCFFDFQEIGLPPNIIK